MIFIPSVHSFQFLARSCSVRIPKGRLIRLNWALILKSFSSLFTFSLKYLSFPTLFLSFNCWMLNKLGNYCGWMLNTDKQNLLLVLQTDGSSKKGKVIEEKTTGKILSFSLLLGVYACTHIRLLLCQYFSCICLAFSILLLQCLK